MNADWELYRDFWIQTYTGKKVYPFEPERSEFFIEDIAHALSCACRFAGHSKRFYSVAQHSVHVAQAVDPANQGRALLHDAAEAYLCDLPKPIKRALGNYRVLETRVMAAIFEQFGVSFVALAEVKNADDRVFMTEVRDLMGGPLWDHLRTGFLRPYDFRIEPVSQEKAEAMFLGMFCSLFTKKS